MRLSAACLWLSGSLWAQSVITTVAGTDFVFTGDGKQATASPIGGVFGVSVAANGDVVAASPTHNLVLRIGADGVLKTVAGNGIKGFSGEGAPATQAALNYPTGTAIGPDGSTYIADFENHLVRRIRNDGVIETVAGNTTAVDLGDGGPALLARLYVPTAVAVDTAGRLYIADNGNHRIRLVETNGTIRTIAGTGDAGYAGDGGRAVDALLSSPQGIAVDASGNVFFGDAGTHTVRRIAADGTISTVAGQSTAGYSGDGGPATRAMLREPHGLALDSDGVLYIADTMNHRLRRVGKDGLIVTVAGTGVGAFNGDGALATAAALNEVSGVAVRRDGVVFLADLANARVRRIGTDGRIGTVAGNGSSKFSGDGGPAVAATLDSPQGLGAGLDGSILIADSVNNRIRRVAADGAIRTIAGTGDAGGAGDGGPALAAQLNHPQGTVVQTKDGVIYFSDRRNNRVRMIDAGGAIRTVAGNGKEEFSGDGGPAVASSLRFPADVDVDADGNLYIADRQNHRVRRVRRDGVIETVAGAGTAGFSGDGGPAKDAELREPSCVTVDPQGGLYICDFLNGRVRRVDADGVIRTVAGNGHLDFEGDGDATAVGINGPYKVLPDGEGRLLIADVYGGRIRRVDAAGYLETIAGTGEARYFGDGDSPVSAGLYFPLGLALRAGGGILIADAGNDRIRAILPVAPSWTLSRTKVALVAKSNGAPANPESVTATSSIPGVRFAARAETVSGGNWLTVSAPGSFLTQTLQIGADPRGLAVGTYQGRVIIDTPGAAPSQAIVDVAFTVADGSGPGLELAPVEMVFSLAEGQSEQQMILLRNRGTEDVPYTVQVDGLERWIQADAGSGVVGPNDPQAVVVRANPSNLAQGEYRASVRVTNQRTAETAILPVRLVVTPSQPVLRLGLTGLSFQAMEGPDATDLPQKVGVLNVGRGTMPWTVTADGTVAWLVVSGGAGVSEAEGQTVPEFTVSVKAGGLAVGEYRARLRVSTGNASEFVDVVLNVIGRGAMPRPMVTRVGLISVVAEGAVSPPSLATGILNLQQGKLEFRSIRGTFDGGNWFVHRPSDGSLDPLQSVGITVQPNAAGLSTGVYEGVITFMFQNQDPRNVKLLMLVTPRPVEGKPAGRSAEACEAGQLRLVFTQLASGFVVKPGQPVPLEVQAADDCGVPMRDGIVLATFDDGSKPLRLASLRDGRWSGTWVPGAGEKAVSVRITGVSAGSRRLLHEVSASGRTGADIQR